MTATGTCTHTNCPHPAEWTYHSRPICLHHAAEINQRIVAYANWSDDAQALADRGLQQIDSPQAWKDHYNRRFHEMLGDGSRYHR